MHVNVYFFFTVASNKVSVERQMNTCGFFNCPYLLFLYPYWLFLIHSCSFFSVWPLLLPFVVSKPLHALLSRGSSLMFIKEISVERNTPPKVVQYEMVIWTTLDEVCSQMSKFCCECCTVSLVLFGHEWKEVCSTGCKHRPFSAPSNFCCFPFTSFSCCFGFLPLASKLQR